MADNGSTIVEAAGRHEHLAGKRCPYCDQPVPNAKAAEIRARIGRERQAVREQLLVEFERDKLQAVAMAREETKKAMEAETRQKVLALEAEKATLLADRETEVSRRVQDAREAFDNDKTTALNAKDAKHFDETRKLTDKLADLQRQLEKKTADDLGEGAEVNLFEELKREFPDDRIERIGKGMPGADIRHQVIHNGKVCGTIIYDSKNHGAWRNDHVDKLARDQRAAKAEHAILSTRKFPSNTQQLHIDDGIIIANPKRVVALVQLLRTHIIHVQTLRLSASERSQKTAALYDFITSERCSQHFNAIDLHAADLLKLQEDERKAHEKTWRKQGTLYRPIQKVRADLCLEIDTIVEAE